MKFSLKIVVLICTCVSLVACDPEKETSGKQNSAREAEATATNKSDAQKPVSFRIATFNAGFDRFNNQGELLKTLLGGDDRQAQKVAEIIQRVDADVLLLNEIDGNDANQTLEVFLREYVERSQNGVAAINYPFVYASDCNTGIASGYDYDNNGSVQDPSDSFGYGHYPGKYCMAVLSRFAILEDRIRSFQHFLWQDMPHFNQPMLEGVPWYTKQALASFRLSSKTHLDVPIDVKGQVIHVLASHPTPPVFDGEEDRNGHRNFDEIRLFADYINPNKGDYLYDDQGNRAVSLPANTRFVLLGDLNASNEPGKSSALMVEGVSAIEQLLQSPFVQPEMTTNPPSSDGAIENAPDNSYAAHHTAEWRMRADYVLPSRYGFTIEDSGVFWPKNDSPLRYLVHEDATSPSSSDHRLVWVDLSIIE